MHHVYATRGTCAKAIEFDLNDGIISNVQFRGGCHGNLQGISKLVEGMKAEDVIARCSGIRCGIKSTSCPDQLTKALAEALGK
ncbi:MAG: TIGR03905 family TSCPD domain-containing protein [Firmicutes bacterium]|nr:TIGR03905 family TSCPD domain-containing protein [Bacillota bacterium]